MADHPDTLTGIGDPEPTDPTASRTIKPRKLTKPCALPIVAIVQTPTGVVALSELTGVVIPFDEYVKNLYSYPRTLTIAYGAETLLWRLHDHWKDHPRWSWRVTVSDKSQIMRKRVSYYGFKDKAKRENRYHLVIDANTFVRGHDKTPDDLLALAKEIRSFCNEHGLSVRPSASGIAAQLLRHPLFYPEARRRVPQFINESVRPHLPGGHYESYAGAAQRMEAVSYIDQENAHHYAAMTTPLPSSNSVRAMGYTQFRERVWARPGGRLYDKAIDTHGLIRAMVTVPPLEATRYDKNNRLVRGPHDFVPRVLRDPGTRVAHIWTNELPYLEQHGLSIEYLIAAWGTAEIDKSLAKYAEWATEQAAKHPHLKPLLLMPYGLLGQRPTDMTFHHPGGTDPLLLANKWLDNTFATPTRIQPRTANVLQLGLIQAYVRALSLDFAKQASENGHSIVSVYVDGVFVKLNKGKQLPIFTPWRIKEEYDQIELASSLRVPVRAKVRRKYAELTNTGGTPNA